MKVYTGVEQVESVIASTDFCTRLWVVQLVIFFCIVTNLPTVGRFTTQTYLHIL